MVSYGTKAVDIYQSKTKDPVKSLWRNVLVVAIEDAIKACVMKHKYKADVTFHDLLYITEPNQDFATICHYADLDHNLVRKKVGLTFKKIEESYAEGNMSDVQGNGYIKVIGMNEQQESIIRLIEQCRECNSQGEIEEKNEHRQKNRNT